VLAADELARVLAGITDPESRAVAADALEECGRDDEASLLRVPTNQVCVWKTHVFMLGCTYRWAVPTGKRHYVVERHVPGGSLVTSVLHPSPGFQAAEVLCRGGLPGNALHLDRDQALSLSAVVPNPPKRRKS
jgi:hypothetical protein